MYTSYCQYDLFVPTNFHLVSKTKKLTSDSKSLLQLDEFRFTGAREWYERETSSVDSEPGLGRAEVLQLVEWKL